jgi:hypothetical protein
MPGDSRDNRLLRRCRRTKGKSSRTYPGGLRSSGIPRKENGYAKKKITAIVKFSAPPARLHRLRPLDGPRSPRCFGAMFCQQFNDRTKGMEPGS